MIKRCSFQLAMEDNHNQIIKDNMLKLFDGIDISVFRFCAIEKERQKLDFGIVAYFFREQNKLDDFVLFSSLLWDKKLFPNDSGELFFRLIN